MLSTMENGSPKFCAVVRQCVFYEKYGGCKFGKDCFYAHNDEMTLGVRNAMQMAQQIGRGGVGAGGVEIRFDERVNEVKMVRVVETFPASNENEDDNRVGFGRNGRRGAFGGGRGGGGRGRFPGRGGRGGGGFRRQMRRRSPGPRFISPVRGSGNIFAESPEARERRRRKERKHERRSRSTTPRKRSKRSNSGSSSPASKGRKKKGSSSSSGSSSSRSRSRSRLCRSKSPIGREKKRSRKRSSCGSPPDPSRMELRSLTTKKPEEKDGQKGEKTASSGEHRCCHHQHRHRHQQPNHKNGHNKGQQNGQEQGREISSAGSKHRRRERRSSSSSSSFSSSSKSKTRSRSPLERGEKLKKLPEGNGTSGGVKSRWEEAEKNQQAKEEANGGEDSEYSPGAVYLMDEREGEGEELVLEEEEQGEDEEERQRRELLEGIGLNGGKKGQAKLPKKFLSIRPPSKSSSSCGPRSPSGSPTCRPSSSVANQR